MTVEAALLLPVALTLVAFLVQPACVLYTRSVMASAAFELCRLVATARCGEDEVRDYALRRLDAVPDVAVFHDGGPDAWEIDTQGPDEQGVVGVSIEGRVRPLPLLGALVAPLGDSDGESVVVRVDVTARTRAAWVEGSYDAWIEMWG